MIVRRGHGALAALAAAALTLSLPVAASAQAMPGQGGQGEALDAMQPQPVPPAPQAAAPKKSGVTVLKGTPLERNAAPAEPGPTEQAALRDNVTIGTGGRTMWFVDRETGQVTDCQSRHTSTPGRRALDCSTYQMPVQ